MAKIVLVGAGSGFGARFGTDIMASEILRDSTVALCDIHPGRLKAVYDYLKRMADEYHLPTKIIASTDRRELLPGADFVLTSIAAGGGAYYGEPFRSEIEIPKKYGIDQSVGDSYSVGSTFRFLRTGPVQLQICHDMEELCPNAYLLNQTNPMSALTTLHTLGSKVKNVGLCHGVVCTADILCGFLGKKYEEISYTVAGMNHFAWFMELKEKATGRDLYPILREKLTHTDDEQVKKFYSSEGVRIDLMKTFGFFPTESNRHDSEYVPYFRRTPELMAQYELPSRSVPDNQPNARPWAQDGAGTQNPGTLSKSREYNIPIMEAMTTDVPFRFNGNILNNGNIPELPDNVCVEVPCFADRHGVHSTVIHLPTPLAGLDRWLVAPVQLMVDAVLEKNKEKAFLAVCEDVNVAAKLSLSEIRAMFEELWAAEGDLLRYYDDGTVVERCAQN